MLLVLNEMGLIKPEYVLSHYRQSDIGLIHIIHAPTCISLTSARRLFFLVDLYGVSKICYLT